MEIEAHLGYRRRSAQGLRDLYSMLALFLGQQNPIATHYYSDDKVFLTPYHGWTVDLKMDSQSNNFEIWLRGPTQMDDRMMFRGNLEKWGFREWIDHCSYRPTSKISNVDYILYMADLKLTIQQTIALFGLQKNINTNIDLEQYLILRWGLIRYIAFKTFMEEKTGLKLNAITLEMALNLESYDS